MSMFKKRLKLFVQFLGFGCFTFGGGWSIVAQMKKTYVEKEKCLTEEELLDITSVGRSLPGTMIGNVAILFGQRVAGFWGGIACLFGMILPPMIILLVITLFYTAFQTNMWVLAALKGIRAAVVPIMFSAVYGLVKSAFKFPPCYVVAVLTFALYMIFNLNCAWLVLIGAACGLAISEYYERREKKK